MRRFLILFALTVLILPQSHSQHSFGLELDTRSVVASGKNIVADSILAVSYNNDREFSILPNSGGVFYEWNITDRLLAHTKILYRPTRVSYTFQNTVGRNCLYQNLFLCPKKVKTSGANVLSFEILPKFRINKKSGFVNIYLLGGISAGFNFRLNQPDVTFGYGRHPGVAKVFNAVEENVKPMNLSLVYGAVLEIWRFSLGGRYQSWSNYTDKIEYEGQEFEFRNSWSFISLSLGYRLFSFE